MAEPPAPRVRPPVVHDARPLSRLPQWWRQFLTGAVLGLLAATLVQLLARCFP